MIALGGKRLLDINSRVAALSRLAIIGAERGERLV